MNEAEILLISNLSVGKVSEMKDFVDLLDSNLFEDRAPELASYIQRLNEEGYIFTSRQTFSEGGAIHPKYGNKVRIIYFDKIELTPEGRQLVQSGELGALSEED